MSVRFVLAALLLGSVLPTPAAAWGYKGHRIVATIARSYLTPAVRDRVDALLAADTDTLEAHDMASAATWADTYRKDHRETAAWHFADIELGRPDLKSACFGFPAPSHPASAGPAKDCVVDRLNAFVHELSDPQTDPGERILALKFVLHFVGDVHQPLHVSDDEDRGGNCVRVALGGSRSTNLHGLWDTGLLHALGDDPVTAAHKLRREITPAQRAAWGKGDVTNWAMEAHAVAQSTAYWPGLKPGCDQDASPVELPAGYEARARATAVLQLERAGVRLAVVLNQALGSQHVGLAATLTRSPRYFRQLGLGLFQGSLGGWPVGGGPA